MKWICIVLTFFSASLFSSCEGSIEPDETLAGEWAYAGSFDRRVDYSCLVCPGYVHDNALYKITFYKDRSLTGKVNLLDLNGFYVTSEKEKQGNKTGGRLRVSKFQATDKPHETQEDYLFQERFRSAFWYEIIQDSGEKYDYLAVSFNDAEYLYFTREKASGARLGY